MRFPINNWPQKNRPIIFENDILRSTQTKEKMIIEINPMDPNHWPDVDRIYREGIATGQATFETTSPSWEKWNTAHLEHSRWVAEIDNQVAGWVALSPVSDRCVYGGVAEVSVYIADNHRGKGIGKVLLNKVIESSEENGIWTLNAATFPENEQSVGLHVKCGFRKIGIREKVGQLDGVWRDTILMEKRSPKF